MDGINKVILLGNLGADPELRMNPGGNAVLKLRVATNESWLDKDKIKQERTEWHRVTVFGKRAEGLAKFLRKGMKVFVEGRNQTSTYDKEGQKRYSTEVIGDQVLVTSSPREVADPSQGAALSGTFPPGSSLGSNAEANGAYGRGPSASADIPF